MPTHCGGSTAATSSCGKSFDLLLDAVKNQWRLKKTDFVCPTQHFTFLKFRCLYDRREEKVSRAANVLCSTHSQTAAKVYHTFNIMISLLTPEMSLMIITQRNLCKGAQDS